MHTQNLRQMALFLDNWPSDEDPNARHIPVYQTAGNWQSQASVADIVKSCNETSAFGLRHTTARLQIRLRYTVDGEAFRYTIDVPEGSGK